MFRGKLPHHQKSSKNLEKNHPKSNKKGRGKNNKKSLHCRAGHCSVTVFMMIIVPVTKALKLLM